MGGQAPAGGGSLERNLFGFSADNADWKQVDADCRINKDCKCSHDQERFTGHCTLDCGHHLPCE